MTYRLHLQAVAIFHGSCNMYRVRDEGRLNPHSVALSYHKVVTGAFVFVGDSGAVRRDGMEWNETRAP